MEEEVIDNPPVFDPTKPFTPVKSQAKEAPVEEVPVFDPTKPFTPVKKKDEPNTPKELSSKEYQALGKLSGKNSTGTQDKQSAKEYADKFNELIAAGKEYGDAFKNGPVADLPTKARLAQDKAKIRLQVATDNLNNHKPTDQEIHNATTELVEGKDIPIEDRIAKASSDFAGGFNRAVLKTPSALMKTEAILANKLGQVFGNETQVSDDFVYAAADKYDKWIDDSDFGKTWVGDKNANSLAANIGSGLGQIATLIATGGESSIAKLGGITPSVFKATVGQVLSKPTLTAFGQVFNSEYEGMKNAGESDDVAFKQALVNAVAMAPLENIPLANLAERFKKSIGSPIALRIVNAITQGAEEGGQEVLQQALSNLTNNQLVDLEKNTKSWSSGLEESGNAGGIVGLLLGTISGVKAGRRKRDVQPVDQVVKDVTTGVASDDISSIENAANVIDEKVKQGEPTQTTEPNAVQKSSTTTLLSGEQGEAGIKGGERGGVEPGEQGPSTAGEGQVEETQKVSDQGSQEKVAVNEISNGSPSEELGSSDEKNIGNETSDKQEEGNSTNDEELERPSASEKKSRTIKILTEEGGRSLPRIKRKLDEGQITSDEANAQVDQLVKDGHVEFVESQPREGTAAVEQTTQGDGEKTNQEGQQKDVLTSEDTSGDESKLPSPEESKSLFKQASDLYYQARDASGAAKKRSIAKQRQEFLDQHPSIKYIDDNVKSIYDQLEKKGIITRNGDCP